MMNRIESPAALQAAQAKYKAALETEKRRVLICTGTGCLASGGLKIYEALQQKLASMGIDCEVQLDCDKDLLNQYLFSFNYAVSINCNNDVDTLYRSRNCCACRCEVRNSNNLSTLGYEVID